MKKLIQLLSIAILIFSTPLYSQSLLVQEIINQTNIDSLTHFVNELSGELPTIIYGETYTISTRNSNYPGNHKAAQYIKQKLESYGLNTYYHLFGNSGENVIGEQLGTDNPEQKYIICAHYDDMPSGSVAPGADDNASGTAAVLEAARIFSNYQFPFTILYALWDEEEYGLIGAENYAADAHNAGDQILGVFNMDMIAWDSNMDNKMNIHTKDIANSLELSDKMFQLNTTYNIGLSPNIKNPGSPASDHAAFWGENFSAILLIEDDDNDFNNYYHTTNDLIDHFNLPYYKKAAKLTYATLAEYALNLNIEIIHDPAPSIAHTGDIILNADISTGLTLGSGLSAPRLFYRISSGGEYSDFYEVIGEEVNSIYSYQFTIPGQSLGTIVQYYLAAQDAESQIVTTLPAGGGGFNPPGSTPPDQYFTFFVAPENVALSDSADNMNNWTTNDNWNLTFTKYSSPPSAFTDSPSGNYSSNENSYLWLNSKIDLTNCMGAILEFDTQWDIEEGWDYGQVQVSTNNGSEWFPIEGSYTTPGSGSFQPPGEPVYDGTQTSWVHETMSLINYAGMEIDLRFLLRSDGWIEEDGWYVDNVNVLTYNFIPVELISFEASPGLNSVSLNWITSTEVNNKGFYIQRSTDLNNWENLEFINGNGTTTEKSYYSFSDGDPVIGKSYYRLMQVDFDGTVKIHNHIKVDLTTLLTYALEQNYPNPFNPTTIIKYSVPEMTDVSLILYDITGRIVKTLINEQKDAGVYEFKLNASDLPSGVYIYRLNTQQYSSTKKLMLVK